MTLTSGAGVAGVHDCEDGTRVLARDVIRAAPNLGSSRTVASETEAPNDIVFANLGYSRPTVGFGCLVVSETEVPSVLANLV
jgi:hypothetical protein